MHLNKMKTKKKNTESQSEYIVNLTIGDKKYDLSGDSILEALSEVKLEKQTKGIGHVSVTYKNKTTKVPIRIFPTKLQQIFSKPTELALFCKRLTTLI